MKKVSFMNKPVRLAKSENYTLLERLDVWAIRHAHILLPLFIIIGVVLFIMLCFAICGISAVESGGMRNFVNGGSL